MSKDAPLTVAIVSTQRKWYGGEEQIALLARGLRAAVHSVHLIARRGGALAQRLGEEGFDVRTFAGNGRNPLAIWQIRRHVRQLRPDVLQYNDSHALTAAGLASWRLPVPVRIAMRHVSLPVRSPRRFQLFSDRVVCVSNAVAEVCRASGIAPELLRVVYAVTDPERIRAGDRVKGRAAAGVSDAQRMLLVVASLNEHKGHAYLLDALPGVLARHPEVRAVFAGDGDQRGPLEDQARRLGIENSVQLLGYRRDVPDLMRGADLVVLPSLAGEGLPVTLVDAVFAGAPVVATPIGGTPELLGTGDEEEPVGWLVPPRDPAALAEAILDILDHPDRAAERARRAERRAENAFTPKHLVEGMLAVYREVLG